ncbi:MAG: SMI1/KNR4 family protein [Pseudomonadota bacterium]|nr:SMI1/KNR4 family protein [Pseudomonadota bacterium]
MVQNFIGELKARHGYDVPAIYHQLHANGMLDWGRLGPDWQAREFERLRARPPLLLYASGFEIMGEAAILDELDSFYAGPEPRVLARHRLLPFGGDGSGDCFCFYFNAQQQDTVPIVHLWHDSDACHFIAADLQDFCFMHMLTVRISASERQQRSCRMDQALLGGGLHAFLESHRPFLKPEHALALDSLYQRRFQHLDDAGNDLMLMPAAEQAEWIERLAPCARRDERFCYAPEPAPEPRPRLTGQLVLTLTQPAPGKDDKRYPLIQAVNWRRATNTQGHATYVRQGYVFFGQPQWEQVDEALRHRLFAVLKAFAGARVEFIDDASTHTMALE